MKPVWIFSVLATTLFVGWIWLRHPKKSFEPFEIGYNSRDIYRSPCPDIDYERVRTEIEKIPNKNEQKQALKKLEEECSYSKSVKRLYSLLQDREDLFLMNTCLASLKDELLDKIQQYAKKADFLILTLPQITASTFQAVRAAVLNEVQRVAKSTKEGALYGHVYALIYQTPHMQSPVDPNRMVTYMNQNAQSYKYQPVNPPLSKPLLNYKVLLFFPTVSKQNQNVARSERAANCRMNFIQKYKSSDELCYVRCLGENDDGAAYPSLCGCKSEGESRCLDSRERISDYGILYTVNSATPLTETLFMNDVQKRAFRQSPSSGI